MTQENWRDNISYSNDYDIRTTDINSCHEVTDNHINKVVNEIIGDNGRIDLIDVGCGDGFVSRQILLKKHPMFIRLDCMDVSILQLERAKKMLGDLETRSNQICYIHDDIIYSMQPSSTYDVVLAKMLLHEVENDKQIVALHNIFRITKNRGKVIIWDVFLNGDSQSFINKIITKKDELAGFLGLARNRYFFTKNELVDNLKNAGVKHPRLQTIFSYDYRFSTRARAANDLQNDETKLIELNQYIRRLSQEYTDILESVSYADRGDDITFDLKMCALVLTKEQ